MTKAIFNQVKYCSLLFLLAVLLGCSTMEKNKQLNIHNYKNDFESFWQESKTLKYEDKFSVWDKHLENKHKDLYLSVYWAKKNTPEKWDSIRKEKMKDSFTQIDKNYDLIIKNFETFDETLAKQINNYKQLFPDADFSKTPIYAVPSLGAFNGKGSSLNSAPEKTILVFGIDMLTWRNDDPDILYSHELFHIYHIDKMNVNEKTVSENAKMTFPLWLEGFATWVSGEFNQKASLGLLLMDEKLGNVPKSKIKDIAREFIKVAEKKAFSKEDPMTYKKWFGIGHGSAIESLPERLGYLLGYFVTAEVAKNHQLEDMVNWKDEKIHQEVTASLKKLAQGN